MRKKIKEEIDKITVGNQEISPPPPKKGRKKEMIRTSTTYPDFLFET